MSTTPPEDFREHLSAWYDGALPVEAARFVLPRLGGDADLRDTLGRWQMIGDALRGQPQAVPETGFALRVAQAIEAQTEADAFRGARSPRRGWLVAGLAVLGLLAVWAWPAAEPLLAPAPLPAMAALTPAPAAAPVAGVVVPLALPASPSLTPEPPLADVPVLVRAPQPSAEQLAPLPAVDAPSRPWPRTAGGAQPFVVDYAWPPEASPRR